MCFLFKERSPSASSRPRIEDKLGLSDDEVPDDGISPFSDNVDTTMVANSNLDQVGKRVIGITILRIKRLLS